MNKPEDGNQNRERRNEPRDSLEKYYSIEMAIGSAYAAYQFKLRNISQSGLCILVREDSPVLDKITVGDVYKVKFYQDGKPQTAKHALAEVRHLTRQVEGRYQGHYLIGLTVKSNGGSGQEVPPAAGS